MSGRSARARRRFLALAAVGLSLAGTSSAYLATSGVTTPSISVAPGTPASGALADVTPMSPSVTNGQGLQVGVALARVTLSSANLNQVRIEVDWTSASVAPRVLHNPNVQISVGIYHTVHSGSCNTVVKSTTEPYVNITDTDNATYCAVLDETTTGTLVDPSNGKMIISKNSVGGTLIPQATSSGTAAACAASLTAESLSETWCNPATVTNANSRALFVVASILTPGGVPQGQQPDLNTMGFFVDARR
ncbi:MAG: hypothetical protein KGL79_02365 [Acidobacteriota bacterium]|nr:hypothetical protein [Acidobacteriota bacterium]